MTTMTALGTSAMMTASAMVTPSVAASVVVMATMTGRIALSHPPVPVRMN
jgi:hypothetical protein